MKETIGQKLIKLRGDKPQAIVAKDIGVSVSTISMYETDERIPRDPIKLKLANYYNVPIGNLFFDE